MNLAEKNRRFLVAGAGAAVLVLVATIWFGTGNQDPATLTDDPLSGSGAAGTGEEGSGADGATGTETVPMRTVELFFPGDDRRLHAMPRELPEDPDPVRNLERVVEALLAGPHGEFAAKAENEATPEKDSDGENGDTTAPSASTEAPSPLGLPEISPKDGLWPPLPAAVSLGRAYFMDDTVILDLEVENGAVPMVGARGEILMLYSLVNTVLLNTEEAKRLVLLWNGQQRSTFAGHFDTTRPLTPKIGLIAR